jgi:hypothetical protein
MFQTASLAEWYKTQGRHEVFARGRSVPLPTLPGQTVPVPMTNPARPAFAGANGRLALPVHGGGAR